MPFQLDTNHCIYLQNGLAKPEKNRTVFEENTVNHAVTISEPIFTSRISVTELYFGAYYSCNTEVNLKKTNTFIEGINIIEVNSEISQIFAEMKSRLRKKGITLSDFDLLIASTAHTQGNILVTNDGDFNNLPKNFIKKDNWAENILKNK
ncbi:PIN domain-containing protein [Candidatus Peregrinibacteria bacterium]|jgi:tRNA(fMet)-specific endonuclease VapC|nr:PIN domain-containing protein [Candidatus Peregrinibacteria bacterium]